LLVKEASGNIKSETESYEAQVKEVNAMDDNNTMKKIS